MNELVALNKMLGALFAYGPSKAKKKNKKTAVLGKRLKANRKSNA